MSKGTVFISDLHLGDIRWTSERYDLFEDFLDSFVCRYAEKVVIAGDLLEWIQYGVSSIRHRLKPLVRLLELPAAGVTIDYVIGNHDIDFCQIAITDKPINFIYPRHHMEIGGRSFHIEHGHFYDPTIQRFPGVARFFAAWAGKALDKVGPGFEDKLGEFKTALLSIGRRTTGQKDASEALEEMDAYINGALKCGEGREHDYVVFGHTHACRLLELNVPGKTMEKVTYVNVGDWQVHSDFAFFSDDTMRVFSWETDWNEAIEFASHKISQVAG